MPRARGLADGRHAAARRPGDLRRRRRRRRCCSCRTPSRYHAILAGAALITLVGAIDDRRELPAVVKLAGQFAAALILVLGGVTVDNFTLPFVGSVDLGASASR